MRGYNWLIGLVLLGAGWPGLVVGQGVDMEEVRRRAEKYERDAAAEAAKKAPAPKPKPQPKPKPKPQPAASVPTPAAPSRSSLEPEMVRIPGGCFQMGSPESETGRKDNLISKILQLALFCAESPA